MKTNLPVRLKCLSAALLGCLTPISVANSAVVAETVYFDITFSSPPHRIGAAPATNAGTAAPTMVSFGKPEVVASFGPLANQPVILNTSGNAGPYYYDQFVLRLGYQQPTYHLSFDLYTAGLIGSGNNFAAILDIPTAAKLGFYSSGIMYPPCWPPPSPLPRFTDSTLMHIDISLDIRNNRSVTLVNGVVVGDGQAIGGASSPRDLSSVRFSLGEAGSASIAIDNIRVTNGFLVPECGISSILMLAGGFPLAHRRRRNRGTDSTR